MGKITGFLEYRRSATPYRPIQERISDYNEFLVKPDADKLAEQAARCMDCGTPFCHAAFVVQGKSIGCPLANLIPEVNDFVYHDNIEAAYNRLIKTNPFPEVTGRVCPALCEGSCTLGEHDQPVTIHDIERYVADEAWNRGYVIPKKPEKRTGFRVAVVGSGPSGLSCAQMLNRLGESVTVFEAADRPGGLMVYGIPNMKLDKQIVARRAKLLEEEGVTFKLSTAVGLSIPAAKLVADYDAVVLCAGAREERQLRVTGSNAEDVSTAMYYLSGATRSVLDGHPENPPVNAKDKVVFVVGGGDTGTDCVGTAIRQGAKRVHQLEIMPCPPKTRAADNPWPLWPVIQRTGYGIEEANALFGHDIREYNTTVKEILMTEGKVTAIKTVEVEWVKQSDGRMVSKELIGTEKTRYCDLVITAMGFTGPERLLLDALELDTDARGNVLASEGDSTGAGGYHTNLPGVFTAGDMRRGPSLVVWAISEGRRVAKECHRYLINKE